MNTWRDREDLQKEVIFELPVKERRLFWSLGTALAKARKLGVFRGG